jgi:hypothetical protein
MSAPETNSQFLPAPAEPAMWCLSWQQLRESAPHLYLESTSSLRTNSALSPASEPAL